MRRAPHPFCALPWALLLLACSGVDESAERPPEDLPHVLLIVVDTLRADRLSIYGYARQTSPTLEKYFADADRYEAAYTAATYTSGSMVSMLSGLYPGAHGVRDFYTHVPEEIALLPDRLRDRGYTTAAIVSNTVLTDEALGWADRFDDFDDFVDVREARRPLYERRAKATTDAALKWLERVRADGKPHFLLLHYMDPHAPYNPPREEGIRRFEHRGPRRGVPLEPTAYQYLAGVDDVGEYLDRYDEEIAYADRELGRFLDAYAKLGFLERSIAIFTSDHGETLLERRPYFEHSPQIGPEVVRVPLLIRRPGHVGAVQAVPVSLVDLVPSILAWTSGVEPADLQGVILDSRRAGDLLFQESREHPAKPGLRSSTRSAISNGIQWRYWLSPEGQIVERGRRFLDRRDPRDPIQRYWGPEADAVREGLAAYVEEERRRSAELPPAQTGSRIAGPKRAPPLEPHQIEALRALGYAE